jgi:predicted TIM-barrel fold metal-dependent hydrolase
MLIDAHVHLPVFAEQGNFEQARHKLLADLEQDGVDYAVLIPDNAPNSPIGDVDTCLRLVENEPRLFLLGTIDIQTQGQPWIARLGSLLAQRKIVGLKIFPGHDPIYPTDPRLAPVYDLCQMHHAPMVIHTGWNSNHPEAAQYNDPWYIVQVARDYPELPIVIAHYDWPEVDYCYELTHGYGNIYYDTSGLADEEVVRATGLDRIHRVLTETLAENPAKVIFGSDYAECSRQAHIALVERLQLQAQVREMVLWRNAVRLFGLKVQP